MSKQVFYKICCNLQNECSDVFVGHTTNYSQKRRFHIINCGNLEKKSTLYTAIRTHGGWDNWRMFKISTAVCNDECEINKLEMDYVEEHGNGCIILSESDPLQYTCDVCHVHFYNNNKLQRHLKTDKHESNLVRTSSSSSVFIPKQVIEVTNNETVNNTNNTNCNNTFNNHFNLHLFLNETCKNALDFNDFVSQLKPQLEDLIYTGETSYASGISNIMVNGLKMLDTDERPIHCSDVKRESLYIKNDGRWEKEGKKRERLLDAVRKVSRMNIKTLDKWKEGHPNYYDYDSKENTAYMQIVGNCMPGCTDEEIEHSNRKIVKNIANAVPISKDFLKQT